MFSADDADPDLGTEATVRLVPSGLVLTDRSGLTPRWSNTYTTTRVVRQGGLGHPRRFVLALLALTYAPDLLTRGSTAPRAVSH